MLCVFCIPPIWVMSLGCCSYRWQNVHNTNHCCEVAVGGAGHFCSSKTTLSFSLSMNDSFCPHLLNSSHVVAVCLLWLFILSHPLSQEEGFGSVYINVWTFFSVEKKEKKKEKCETFEFVCVRVSFAVAAVNGKRQPSLAKKSVSHALALQPLPWQRRLCTRRFLPLCFYMEWLLASKRLQQGPSLSLPF